MVASGQAHRPAFLTGPLPRRLVTLTAIAVVAILPQGGSVASAGAAPLGAGQAGPASDHTAGSYVLTADSTSGNYAPTFTGNGYIGIRVPPVGQGYAATPVPVNPTNRPGRHEPALPPPGRPDRGRTPQAQGHPGPLPELHAASGQVRAFAAMITNLTGEHLP
jgi:hypothetical protein